MCACLHVRMCLYGRGNARYYHNNRQTTKENVMSLAIVHGVAPSNVHRFLVISAIIIMVYPFFAYSLTYFAPHSRTHIPLSAAYMKGWFEHE